MSGKLYALSTGPGAADLITVRAARVLGKLDILYAPAGRTPVISQEILANLSGNKLHPAKSK